MTLLGPDVGTAHITVKPSLRGWSRSMREELRREMGGSAGSALDDAVSGPGGRGAQSAGRRSGEQFAGGFDREVRTRLSRALDRLPPVQIGAATSEAEQKLRDLRTSLERLRSQRIGIDVNAATAIAQIIQLREQLTDLGHASPDIQVQADTLSAAAQLTALQAQIDAVSNRVEVDADADTTAATVKITLLGRIVDRLNGRRIRLEADGSPLDGMSRRAQLLLTLFATLGPALLPLGAVLISLAASFTATFTAAAAGIGILLAGVLGAIVPVIKAQGELEQKQKAADSAAKSYAAAQQGVAAASRGVADAERSASRSVADAARALADARRSAARAVVAAEDAVRDAQAQARDAQQALNQARDEARDKLAAYRDQLRGAALDESGAALSVTAAREALNNALTDSSSSQLDIDQARQALDEAQFAYDQAGKRGNKLRAQAKKDRAAGVSGDQGVIDARERLAAANDDVADAERALGQARADAARSVADAERNLARARSDGARSVAAAEDQLAQARQASADAAAANAAAQADLAETMAKLSGPAAIFVAALDRAKAAWKEFVGATAGDSFGLAVTVLDMFSALLPNLVPLFHGAAAAVGVLLDDLAKFGKGEEGQSFLDWLTRRAPGAIISMARSIGNLVKGLGYLVGALAENDSGFLAMTRRFARWAKSLGDSPGLKRFLAYVRRMRPVVGAALGAIADAFVNIVIAAAPIGTFILKAVTAFSRAIARTDPDVLLAIAAAFLAIKAAAVIFTVVGALIEGLAVVMGAAAAAGGGLAGVLAGLAAVNPFVWVVLAVVALVLLYKKVGAFRDFVNKAFETIKRVVLEVWQKYLKPALQELGATATDLWKKHIGPAFREIGRIISNAWTNIIKPALKAWWFYITRVLIPVVKFLWFKVIKPYMSLVANYIRFQYTKVIRPIFNAWWAILSNVVIPIIKYLWKNIVKPLFENIGSKIKTTWGVIRPVLVAFRDFVRDTLVPAIRDGLGKIGGFFDGLKKAAGTPVKFIVETVFNNGIRKVINAIPGVHDLDAVDTSKWPSFARGGVLPGYTPGRDVHRFVSPTAGILNLSGGEGILIPQAVRQLGGAPGIHRLNAAARAGRLGEQSKASGGTIVFPVAGGYVERTAYNLGHDGMDINAANDSSGKVPYMSATSGTVTTTGYSRGYGNAVFVRSPYGELVYGHSFDGSVRVSPGDKVTPGQWLANIGNTGNSNGAHLHFGFPGGTFGAAEQLLAGSIKSGGLKRLKGPGEVLTDKFTAALKAIAGFVKDGPGWAKKISGMKPWGPLLRSGLHDTGDNLADFVNGKVPGSPMRNVFDQGGLALGTGVMFKKTIRPERVLSPTQTALYERQVASLEGWGAGMRSLEQIAGQTRAGSQVLSVREFRIKDWEKGLATMEVIAIDAAHDVVNNQGAHAQRISNVTAGGYDGMSG